MNKNAKMPKKEDVLYGFRVYEFNSKKSIAKTAAYETLSLIVSNGVNSTFELISDGNKSLGSILIFKVTKDKLYLIDEWEAKNIMDENNGVYEYSFDEISNFQVYREGEKEILDLTLGNERLILTHNDSLKKYLAEKVKRYIENIRNSNKAV